MSDPPKLKTNHRVTHAVGDQNVTVDLGLTPLPFPKPSRIRVEKDGQRIGNSGEFGDFSLVDGSVFFFKEISADHAGTYQLTATNYHLNNTSKEVGTAIGSFTLDVLCEYRSCLLTFLYTLCVYTVPLYTDGPELTPGPEVYYVILGQPVTLVFGYDLRSNPPITIVLTDPSGDEVNGGENFELDRGPHVVQIHINTVDVKHRGIWDCGLYQHNGDKLKSYVVTLVVLGKCFMMLLCKLIVSVSIFNISRSTIGC